MSERTKKKLEEEAKNMELLERHVFEFHGGKTLFKGFDSEGNPVMVEVRSSSAKHVEVLKIHKLVNHEFTIECVASRKI